MSSTQKKKKKKDLFFPLLCGLPMNTCACACRRFYYTIIIIHHESNSTSVHHIIIIFVSDATKLQDGTAAVYFLRWHGCCWLYTSSRPNPPAVHDDASFFFYWTVFVFPLRFFNADFRFLMMMIHTHTLLLSYYPRRSSISLPRYEIRNTLRINGTHTHALSSARRRVQKEEKKSLQKKVICAAGALLTGWVIILLVTTVRKHGVLTLLLSLSPALFF
jgi:hypothetical protein